MLGKKYSGNSNDPGNSRNVRKRDNKIIFSLVLFLVLFSFLGIYLVNDNYITGAFLGILPIENISEDLNQVNNSQTEIIIENPIESTEEILNESNEFNLEINESTAINQTNEEVNSSNLNETINFPIIIPPISEVVNETNNTKINSTLINNTFNQFRR